MVSLAVLIASARAGIPFSRFAARWGIKGVERKFLRSRYMKYIRRAAPVAAVATAVPTAAVKRALHKGLFIARRHPRALAAAAPVAAATAAIAGRTGDLTPGEHGEVVYSWTANGVLFQKNQDGTITVRRKDGTTKTYRPRFHNPAAPPIKVMKAANRFLAAAKKWDKLAIVKKKSKSYKKPKKRR